MGGVGDAVGIQSTGLRWKFLYSTGDLKYLNGKLFGECFVKNISLSEVFLDLILFITVIRS